MLCLVQLIFRSDFVLTEIPVKFSLFLITGGVVFFLGLIMEVASFKCLDVGVIMITLRELIFVGTNFRGTNFHGN